MRGERNMPGRSDRGRPFGWAGAGWPSRPAGGAVLECGHGTHGEIPASARRVVVVVLASLGSRARGEVGRPTAKILLDPLVSLAGHRSRTVTR